MHAHNFALTCPSISAVWNGGCNTWLKVVCEWVQMALSFLLIRNTRGGGSVGVRGDHVGRPCVEIRMPEGIGSLTDTIHPGKTIWLHRCLATQLLPIARNSGETSSWCMQENLWIDIDLTNNRNQIFVLFLWRLYGLYYWVKYFIITTAMISK